MDIHSRIQQRRLELGLSAQELAEAIGISRQNVLQWELPEDQKGTTPRRDRIKKVADQLKTTVEWLTSGINANVDPNDKYAFVPRYAEAKKGVTRVDFHNEIAVHTDGQDTYAYRKDFLAGIGVEVYACRVIITNDNSMNVGSQLLVNTADKALCSTKLYALSTANGVLVRRVVLLTDGRVELHADHPAIGVETYQPAALPTVLGRIVAAQTTFD